MLQAILFRSRNRAVGLRRPLLKHACASTVLKLHWHRSISSLNNQKQLLIRTVVPSKLTSSQQEVLDLSLQSKSVVYCKDEPEKPVQLQYEPNEAFPPNTRGVFYYLHYTDRSHLRFRLCASVKGFRRGKDLLRRDGHAWKLSMDHMTTWTSAYLPLLNLVSNELPQTTALMDKKFAAHRMIFTLSPQDLVAKGQPVLDIPDCVLLELKTSLDDEGRLQIHYQYVHGAPIPFPANTRGVFYYKQSATSPTTIGELRFRLCDDPASFEAGTDLCLRSGLPWCISSKVLYSVRTYSGIRKQLLHEGLLLNGWARSRGAAALPLISGLNQPFAVNLSLGQLHIIVTGPVELMMRIKPFHVGSEPLLYNGRAVVQLERYPDEYIGNKAKKPLFALRFLEFLTPVQVIPHDSSTRIQHPKAGELLYRLAKDGRYSPWGYRPNGTSLKAVELAMHTPSI